MDAFTKGMIVLSIVVLIGIVGWWFLRDATETVDKMNGDWRGE